MSADDYYSIRKDMKTGQFVPVWGSASNDDEPEIQPRHKRYDNIRDAIDYAWGRNPEYGVSIHDECKMGDIIFAEHRDIASTVLLAHFLLNETTCKCGQAFPADGIRESVVQHQSELIASALAV